MMRLIRLKLELKIDRKTLAFTEVNTSTLDATLLDEWLDHVSRCFTPETARALANLPPHEAVRRRMLELGSKSSSGELTPDEAREYDTYIEVGDLLAALQLKARALVTKR